jgi:hypothetical protein
MGFPIRIVNTGVSADSAGSITLTQTTAGNLLVVVVGFSGSASLDIDALTEVVANTASIWYCVLTVGGVATVSFAASGPGAWVFELACPDSDWTLLDQQSATGAITSNNVYSPPPFGAVEAMAALTGNSFNCCYFTVLHGSAVIAFSGTNFRPAVYSPGWLIHPAVFGTSFGGGDVVATTVCIMFNNAGRQQFQLWIYNDPVALVGLEHESIGAVFGPPS